MEMNLENLSKQELLKLIKDTEKELQKKDKLIEKHESLITRNEFEGENHLLTISHQNHLTRIIHE
jgi:ATP adenylyltransferase/5',5'''-P-1,P-4-tetraphosphate phosphorylase II